MRILAASHSPCCVARSRSRHDGPHPSAATAARMRVAAEQVLAALPPAAREKVSRPFDDRDRTDWHYTPRSRNGIALKELDAQGRDAVHALLKEALSAAGYRKVVNIVELELVLRELETFGLMRDPERYHLTIYGTPSPYGRVGLAVRRSPPVAQLHAGRRQGRGRRAELPGRESRATCRAGPRRACACSRRKRTRRARSWHRFPRRSGAKRSSNRAPTARSSRATPPRSIRCSPSGIAASSMTEAQRAQLMKLVEVYAATFEPGLAQARMARVSEGGVEKIRFGWAGATERGKQHYYRVQGPLFLIEYDASQDGGNHIHSVWRDFTGDFGRDLLREHYQNAKGTAHKH